VAHRRRTILVQINKLLLAFVAIAGIAGASTISSTSATDGTILNTLALTDVMNGSNLDGTQVIAQLASGGFVSCTFVGASCNSTAGVVVVNADTIQVSTVWVITNTTGQDLVSVTIQLAGAAFNPCVGGNQPLLFISTCAADSPGGGNARSLFGSSPNLGTTSSAASATFTNRVRLGVGNPSNDLFTQVQLIFGTNGTPFHNGETFSFIADTDLLNSPEPATYGLVGGALLALACLRRAHS
jgi:hypothetical protein